jgi:hypothetical protein
MPPACNNGEEGLTGVGFHQACIGDKWVLPDKALKYLIWYQFWL